jgi:hypothetical protein
MKTQEDRVPDMDSKPDNFPEGYYSKYHPLWKSETQDSKIGITMKGVLFCTELHKFHVSNRYGRAEAQRDFVLQHVALPNNLSWTSKR